MGSQVGWGPGTEADAVRAVFTHQGWIGLSLAILFCYFAVLGLGGRRG